MIELNTGLFRIFNGTYNTIWEVSEYDDDGNELDLDYSQNDFMQSIAGEYAEQSDAILREMDLPFITDIRFTGGVYSPKEYNFSTDVLDFEVDVDEAKLKVALDGLKGDQKFAQFLIDNYRSRDGFWSFTPDNYEELYTELVEAGGDNYHRSLGAVMSYLVGETTMDAIEEMVYETWRGNGYGSLEYTIVREETATEQPVVQADGALSCPKCSGELNGDGENRLECENCDYSIHEADICSSKNEGAK